MAAANDAGSAPSPAFIKRFEARAAKGLDRISDRLPALSLRFDEFMEIALYDPEVGYYRAPRSRVGRTPGTDFFTATSSGPLFGELVCAACAALLPLDLRNVEFVEIGAETAEGVLAGVNHPFKKTRTLRVGEPLLISGPCVVFSNELFDAQPFRRWKKQGGLWCELGVALEPGAQPEGAPSLRETIWSYDQQAFSAVLEANQSPPVPEHLPDGYTLDLPVAASSLIDSLLLQPWTGLFLAFDYGKSWAEIAHAQPGGTARAYFQHTQSNALLAHPGEQDLTCHVIWDWLEARLQTNRFEGGKWESQEGFFVHHAGDWIARVMAAEAERLSQRKLGLMQLLHPAHMGQKFQVLHGVRK